MISIPASLVAFIVTLQQYLYLQVVVHFRPYFDSRKIRQMRQPAVAVNVNSDSLVMPLLHVPEVNLPLVRRLQCWQFSIILHSFTAILCIWKDDNTTIARYCGPAILFVCSIAQLGFLLCHYPVTEDVLTIGLNICLGCWLYLLLVFTDFNYFKDSHISITFEILLIAFTVCMHALRFATQDLFEFNWFRLIVAAVGCSSGVPTLFKIHDLFSKRDTALLFAKPASVFVDPIVDGHIMFKVSTLLGALFRLLDVILICVPATRDAANYLVSKLQECSN